MLGAPPAWLHLNWTKALFILWVGTLLLWIALGADMIFRSARQDRRAVQLARGLHLTRPAYFPAGHPWRHPESGHPGVEARHSPRLPPYRPPTQLLPEVLPPWEPLP